MAISIDTIYQRVLALANKEQRGYITPQEFNLYANQAQIEIFEQYFYDLNQFKRLPNNDNEYHNMVNLIEEKLYPFRQSIAVSSGTDLETINCYRLGNVYKLQSGYTSSDESPFDKSISVEEVNITDLISTQSSPLTKATKERPVYYVEGNVLQFIPEEPIDGEYRASFIKRPFLANWSYIVVNEKPLYNHSAVDRYDFELHESEEPELVNKILALSGIGLKDYNVVQTATQKELSQNQQQKQ
jgi:hypothetical protein